MCASQLERKVIFSEVTNNGVLSSRNTIFPLLKYSRLFCIAPIFHTDSYVVFVRIRQIYTTLGESLTKNLVFLIFLTWYTWIIIMKHPIIMEECLFLFLLNLCSVLLATQQRHEYLALRNGDTITGSVGSEFTATSPIMCSRRYHKRIYWPFSLKLLTTPLIRLKIN